MIKKFYKDYTFIKNYYDKLTVLGSDIGEFNQLVVDYFDLISKTLSFMKDKSFKVKSDRIFYFLKEVLTKNKFTIDFNELIYFLNQYQKDTKTYLSYNEIYGIKTILICIYIGKISDLCFDEANHLNNQFLVNKIPSFTDLETIVNDNIENNQFLFLLYQKVKYNNVLFRKFTKIIYDHKISLHEIIEKEKQKFIDNTISLSNILKEIQLTLNYKDIDLLEKVSKVEKELLKRKNYKNMTNSSKAIFREKLMHYCFRKRKDVLQFVKENENDINFGTFFKHYFPVLDYRKKVTIHFASTVVVFAEEINLEKVNFIFEKFEKYYQLYRNKNIYYTLVTDSSGSDLINSIHLIISKLNQKYNKKIFHFICFNEKISNQFVFMHYLNKALLLEFTKEDNLCVENTFLNNKTKIKYVILNDLNQKMTIDTIIDLIGCISHPLNEERKYICIKYKDKLSFGREKNYIYDLKKLNTLLSSCDLNAKWIKKELLKKGFKEGYLLKDRKHQDAFSEELVFNHYFEDAVLFHLEDTNHLDTLSLSNGDYTIILDSFGRSISKYKTLNLNRKRQNGILYIKDLEDDSLWTNTPYLNQEHYHDKFLSNKAIFMRTDSHIKTTTEIIVSLNYNVELRKITITNTNSCTKTFDITSYYDVLLSENYEDENIFNTIFINSYYDDKLKALISYRNGKSNYMFHKMLLSNPLSVFSYTTDYNNLFDKDGNYLYSTTLNNQVSNHLEKVMSLKNRIEVKANSSVSIYLISGYARNIDQIHNSLTYYSSIKNIEEEYKVVTLHNRFCLKDLNIDRDMEKCYNSFLTFLVNRENFSISLDDYDVLRKNSLSKSNLLKYKLDSNYPTLLLEIKDVEKINLLYDLLKMFEYYKSRAIFINIVILVDHPKFTYFKRSIYNELYRINHLYSSYKNSGTVLVLNHKRLSREEKNLFYTIADIRVHCDRCLDFLQMLDDLDKKMNYNSCVIHDFLLKGHSIEDEDLLFDNSYGGFTKDLESYVIYNNETPRPWSNILANPSFGSIVTNYGDSYTYFDYSSEFRITKKNASLDSNYLSEGFKLNGSLFKPNKTIHGFGYSIFHGSNDYFAVSLCQFVPLSDTIKVCILEISNQLKKKQEVCVNYFINPLLGSSCDDYKYVLADIHEEENFLQMRNVIHLNNKDAYAFLSSSSKIGDYHIDHISRKSIDVYATLNCEESVKVVFLLGSSTNEENIKSLVHKYSHLNFVEEQFQQLKSFWNQQLMHIQVDTQDVALNLFMKWSLYQEISNRYAHANYYNYRGIYNCKERLLSALNLLLVDSKILKEQILLTASHQFIKGDILYWFYDKNKFGLRNRCFDSQLIFAYSLLEYISNTLDYDILLTDIAYIQAEDLSTYEKEKIVVFREGEKASLLEHLIKSIDLAIQLCGTNSIPFIGQSDFDSVITDNSLLGESIINGFMLYKVLDKFLDLICVYDNTIDIQSYKKIKVNLKKKLNHVGYEKDHYIRCLYESGEKIGSIDNLECNIDLLSQSFSILSGVVLKSNISKIINKVDKSLYDENLQIIKYIDKPFTNSLNDVGMISHYPIGYFENGGSSIKATLLYIIALVKVGYIDKAYHYLKKLLPINRDISSYKIEPYFVGSYIDCLGCGYINSDYTAGLFYYLFIKYFLGFNKVGNTLTIEPKISDDFHIVYHYFGTSYSIKMNKGKKIKYVIDGKVEKDNKIKLIDDGQTHSVNINFL